MHLNIPDPPKQEGTSNRLLVVCGPTASGKTDLAVAWSRKYGWPIINADSRQVYAEMQIGTARPTEAELSGTEHFLFGTVSILNHYNAGIYAAEVEVILKQLFKQHSTVILCGGTGLYIQAVISGLDDIPTYPFLRSDLQSRIKTEGLFALAQELKDLDPEYAAEADLKNPSRVVRALEVVLGSGLKYSELRKAGKKALPFEVQMVMPNWSRVLLYDRINSRTEKMLAEGWLNEAHNLLEYKELKALQTVGYPELFEHLSGDISLEEAINKIRQKTRNYAKRQLTFFSNNPNFANKLLITLAKTA